LGAIMAILAPPLTGKQKQLKNQPMITKLKSQTIAQ
jgi:hypothetical protein